MREIKFRGKCVPDSKFAGEWVTGGYVEPLPLRGSKQNEGLIIAYFGGNTTCTYHVIPETIGQYTGLSDQNCKEIYEGDIIYSEFGDGSNAKCLVGWDGEKACFGIMDEYAYRSKTKGCDFPEFDSDVLFNFRKHGVRFEVIGNIYDNPELMN